MLIKKDGQLFFKAEKLPKKEHDKPAYRAVYGIEAQAKEMMEKAIVKSVSEMGKKLISQYK